MENDDNPYAPPRSMPAARAPTRASSGAAGSSLKWVYLGAAVPQTVLLGWTHIVPQVQDVLNVIVGVSGMLTVLRYAVGLTWLHRAWSDIPEPERAVQSMTPGRAVGYHFIPFVNFVWLFIAQRRLCTAMDVLLVTSGKKTRSPIAWATIAPAAHLCAGVLAYSHVPLVIFVAQTLAAACWFVYMLYSDRARRVMVRALAKERRRDERRAGR